jgi:hypothetical protein
MTYDPKLKGMFVDPGERSLKYLREMFPDLFSECEDGNALAAIALHCLECQGGVPLDVKRCKESICSLHRFRLKYRVLASRQAFKYLRRSGIIDEFGNCD